MEAEADQQQDGAQQIDHIVGQALGIGALQLQEVVGQHHQQRAHHTDGIYNPGVHSVVPERDGE